MIIRMLRIDVLARPTRWLDAWFGEVLPKLTLVWTAPRLAGSAALDTVPLPQGSLPWVRKISEPSIMSASIRRRGFFTSVYCVTAVLSFGKAPPRVIANMALFE